MAGWSFVVTPQSPTEYAVRLDRHAILAQWITGAGGIGWIDDLANDGRAERLQTGGYPNTYTALACDVVPFFQPDLPPFGGKWPQEAWQVTVRWDDLKALEPETRLTIVVWDQS